MKTVTLLIAAVLSAMGCSSHAGQSTSRSSRVLDVSDLNTEQIKALDRAHTAVMLIGGILEEHGPYLPSYSDGYQTSFLADRVSNAIAARPGWMVLRLPPIPLGTMPANELGGHYSFAGSYPVRMTTLRAVFMDLATDLGEAGFKWVFVLNYHGGPTHNRALDDASQYFTDTYGGRMINLAGLVSVAGAAPHDLFSKAEREAEGFSVHADADEHSRMLFLRPDLVVEGIHHALPVVTHEPSELLPVARQAEWPGYFGTPAIANAAAGRRSMEALAAAAVDATLKALDGTLGAAPTVWTQDGQNPSSNK